MRAVAIQILLVVVTLAVSEAILRVIDLRFLRDGFRTGYSLAFAYDAELGWLPVPHAVSKFTGSRTFTMAHNSLGLRDIEPDNTARKTILFLGDSFTWGYDVEVQDRFTERLRLELPQHRIVNAGVPGYGTDQEFLLLRRLWSRIKPNVVVLIFCVRNDREDNSANARYGGYYKPYLEVLPDGSARFRGLPAPQSRQVYFHDNAFARNSWLARVAVSAFVQYRHPIIEVPDPTERLVGMMRDFVKMNGAHFLVGLQRQESKLESYLVAQNIPYTTFDGAQDFDADGSHWTPKGHDFVASRLMTLFSETRVIP